ncbi:hypothetical protein HIM_11689 [Hirsutella minnesotensis 3608]|uniref:Uncharacterized protein n=1 Tax=Hirsutella minnesotensis 3608 TaxID=1043627 RepID=A0A0F7ZWG3_9HYPO|nr:hypothetical protein HIM_11689 [Hirsutella minnesotensis 3608]
MDSPFLRLQLYNWHRQPCHSWRVRTDVATLGPDYGQHRLSDHGLAERLLRYSYQQEEALFKSLLGRAGGSLKFWHRDRVAHQGVPRGAM